jgi:hypothetical protein
MTTLINKDRPLRERIMFGLLVLFFLFIVQVLATILPLVAVFQFFATLISGKANEKLQSFSESLAEYFKQITLFISYIDENKPWPFSPWPEVSSIDNRVEDVVEPEPQKETKTETTKETESKNTKDDDE